MIRLLKEMLLRPLQKGPESRFFKFHPEVYGGRPPESKRLFRSEVAERELREVSSEIKDPEIRKMFEHCYPNTLDTTVFMESREGKPFTFVITGDIHAMWIRDSTNQVKPYIPLAQEDEKIRRMLEGLIRAQAFYLNIDPYANAFRHPKIKAKRYFGEGEYWHSLVFERKYELDSISYFLDLSSRYFRTTRDTSPFDDRWIEAVKRVLTLIKNERLPLKREYIEKMYRFYDSHGKPFPSVRLVGYNYPGAGVGLVRTVFRPSDDEAHFPYNVPQNAHLLVSLKALVPLLRRIKESRLVSQVQKLSKDIEDSLNKYAVVRHHYTGERIFPYELDGYGSVLFMDDPNIPSLLALPYLGFLDRNNKVYKDTRSFILSEQNPFYFKGKYFEGLGSPHTPIGMVWPMATITRALTTDDHEEIEKALHDLKQMAKQNHYFMMESIDVDDPRRFTRPWFGWANSYFAELILDLRERAPEILKRTISV